MNNHADYASAKKSVNARLGFYIHLTAYLVVNASLIFINLATSRDHLWFPWPLAGWGLGLLAHGVATFVLPGLRGKMVEKEIKQRSSKD